jgi:DNA-binding MarR family transcriptional regulator
MSDIDSGLFDRVLHSGPRITILSRLIIHRAMRFNELAKSTGLTAGNVSAHITVLEEAGYIERQRLTNKVESPAIVRITQSGDEAFRVYVRKIRAAFAQFEAPSF